MKPVLFKLYHNAIKLQYKHINHLTNSIILYNLVIETRLYQFKCCDKLKYTTH